MATLLTEFVTGFPSAPSGTAEFYARGTTDAAMVYADHSADTAIGTEITLDSSGAYQHSSGTYGVYVTQPVDVVIRTSGGTVLRRYTPTIDVRTVDLENASFTGTLDSGSTGAGGLSLLSTALTGLVSSFGTTDFQVIGAGSTEPRNLKDILVAIGTGNYFNVKDSAYGAEGDGSVDDTNAIQNCINAAVAAGGGIIIIPPGTYKISSAVAVSTSTKIQLWGYGHRATVIKNHGTTTNAFSVNTGGATVSGIVFRGIGIEANTSSTGYGISCVQANGVSVEGVRVSGHARSIFWDTPIENRVLNCQLDGGSGGSGLYIDNAATRCVVSGTAFYLSGGTCYGIYGAANTQYRGLAIVGSHFVESATATSTGIRMGTVSGTQAHVVGCHFYSLDTAYSTGSSDVLSGNAFDACTTAIAAGSNVVTESGSTLLSVTTFINGSVRSATRDTRVYTVSAISASTLNDFGNAANTVFTASGGASTTITLPTGVSGNVYRLSVVNISGGAYTVNGGATTGPSASLTSNQKAGWSYVHDGTNWRCVGHVAAH